MIDKNWPTTLSAIPNSWLRGITVCSISGLLTLGSFVGPTAIGQSADTQSADAQTADKFQPYTKTITIRPGDTLSHIARREMGNAELAQQLAESNDVDLQTVLKPGDSLNVPVSLPVRDEHASVLFYKGQVTINGDAIKPDDKVRRNDVLETGTTGYASLEFSTGTLINLQPNTVARIVTLHCQSGDETCIIEMVAERGTLSTDVRSDGDQPTDFRVQTPYASAAVRGTVFDINADSTGLRIGVTEGLVAVGAANSEQVVDLDIGFGSVAAPGAPISDPIDLLPAPVYRFVPPRITQSDVVRWFGLTDVNRYIVQIAPETNGVGVIHDTVVQSDLFSFDEDLPSGDYHILLRAVDENGLMGFTASSPITIADEDTNIAPVTAVVERENGNYRIEIIDAPDEATGYEIQVASDESFTDPVSVDIDESGLALVRLGGDNFFARARALIDRTTVGPYGESTTVNEQ